MAGCEAWVADGYNALHMERANKTEMLETVEKKVVLKPFDPLVLTVLEARLTPG